MEDKFFRTRRDHAYRAHASFAQLARFSHTYMRVHDAVCLPQQDDRHIFMLGDYGRSIRMELIDKDGRRVDAQDDHETACSSKFGPWLGYPATVAHGFKWTSCSGSVLVAQKLDEVSPAGEILYELQCWPAAGEEGCGYIDTLRRIGVRFTEILPARLTAPAQTPALANPPPESQGDDDRDVEPEWCPIQMSPRPRSLC